MTELYRPLTARQAQVADAVGRGLSYAAIALEIGAEVRTVKAHVHAIAMLIPNPDGLPAQRLVMLWAAQRHVRDQSA